MLYIRVVCVLIFFLFCSDSDSDESKSEPDERASLDVGEVRFRGKVCGEESVVPIDVGNTTSKNLQVCEVKVTQSNQRSVQQQTNTSLLPQQSPGK